MLKKILFAFVITTLLVACKDEPKKYSLEWDIPEVVIYNIQMKTIDSLSTVPKETLKDMVESVSKIYGENINVNTSTESLYKGLINQLNMLSYFAIVEARSFNVPVNCCFTFDLSTSKVMLLGMVTLMSLVFGSSLTSTPVPATCFCI